MRFRMSANSVSTLTSWLPEGAVGTRRRALDRDAVRPDGRPKMEDRRVGPRASFSDGAAVAADGVDEHTQMCNKVPSHRRMGGHDFGGEFDPGSGLTLAACLMHASRTGRPSGRLRGGRVRNAWGTCLLVGGSHRKRWVIPHKLGLRVGDQGKPKGADRGSCGRLACWWGNGLPRR